MDNIAPKEGKDFPSSKASSHTLPPRMPPWEKVTLRWGPRLGQKFFTDVDYALVVFSTKGKGHLQGKVFAIGYKTAGDITYLLTGAN